MWSRNIAEAEFTNRSGTDGRFTRKSAEPESYEYQGVPRRASIRALDGASTAPKPDGADPEVAVVDEK
jgi:hypothetical protein